MSTEGIVDSAKIKAREAKYITVNGSVFSASKRKGNISSDERAISIRKVRYNPSVRQSTLKKWQKAVERSIVKTNK